MRKIRVIDPPFGWMYGFPKEDDWDASKETRKEWWIRNGYPQELVDSEFFYCRYWEHEVEE